MASMNPFLASNPKADYLTNYTKARHAVTGCMYVFTRLYAKDARPRTYTHMLIYVDTYTMYTDLCIYTHV